MKKPRKTFGFLDIFLNCIFLLKIAIQNAPIYTINKIFDETINRICIFIEHVFLVGYIINVITEGKSIFSVLKMVLIIFSFVLIFQVLRNAIFGNYINPLSEQKIIRSIRLTLYKKAINLDLQAYDDPKFYNDFLWSITGASSRIFGVLNSISKCLGAVIYIIVTGSYILSKDIAGLIIVLLSFFGILFLGKIKNHNLIVQNEEIIPHQHEQNYMSRIMYMAEYAKEIRVNNIKDKLIDNYDKSTESIKKIIKKRARIFIILDFLSKFVFESLMIDFLYLIYLMYKTIIIGSIPYGTMVILYNSCWQARHCLSNLAASLPEFQEHSLYIQKIRKFLAYENKVVSVKNAKELIETIDKIEFRNVSFSYNEKDDKEVLKDIDITINRGEKIAIVGLNGSGKSTFIKLLLRMYDPRKGEIILNGKNIKDYSLNSYRGKFGTIFQDFQIFATTIGENITADIIELDHNKADYAVKMSGFFRKLVKLINKYSTQLTKEFDDNGTLLSGGECQSLAITRVFYKEAPILIMDEPSSALDASVENEFNNIMFNMDNSKTAIMISHRLSTIRSANHIYFFKNGHIIEHGSHNELMKENGKYAEMFRLQASKYQID